MLRIVREFVKNLLYNYKKFDEQHRYKIIRSLENSARNHRTIILAISSSSLNASYPYFRTSSKTVIYNVLISIHHTNKSKNPLTLCQAFTFIPLKSSPSATTRNQLPNFSPADTVNLHETYALPFNYPPPLVPPPPSPKEIIFHPNCRATYLSPYLSILINQ